MNARTTVNIVVLSCAVWVAGVVSARAQGILTPPGAPAPTMKTLEQIEPRIPISSAPVTLSTPGSYYLTTNLSGMITIDADNIAVDMIGFTLTATNSAGFIMPTARQNVHVRNGIVSSAGTYGFDFSTSTTNANGSIEGVVVADSGADGILVGGGFVVQECIVHDSAWAGVCAFGNSIVRDCRLTSNGDGLRLVGSGAYVADNIVKGNGDNYNIAAGNHLNLLLCEIPERLEWPCSVKLAGSLTCAQTGTDGITIEANDVTVDLAGHTLIGVAGSENGIHAAGSYETNLYNIHIYDGTVRGWGSQGIRAWYAANSRLTGIHAYSNGSQGVSIGGGSVIKNCVAKNNQGTGIYASDGCTIVDCAAMQNQAGFSGTGNCVFRGCAASGNTSSGIDASDGLVVDCSAEGNGEGIRVSFGGAVIRCVALDNVADGIYANGNCLIRDNLCKRNGDGSDGAGIYLHFDDGRIEGNHLMQNDWGIYTSEADNNLIIRNSAIGNTTNYHITGTQIMGPIITTTGTITNGNPWANFSL